MLKQRIAVAALTMSAAGFATWQASEGYTERAVIPTKGDVPTIGHGSTRYEDGRPVRMGDTITPPRARALARNLMQQDCKRMAGTLADVRLYQEEYDVYCNFVGQFGIGNWRSSSMRTRLLAGDYAGACDALLLYKYSAGYDCSTPGNKRCAGVWTRQLERNRKCLEAQ
jgi:GH24 family phage-related lysozyme (muramidase)